MLVPSFSTRASFSEDVLGSSTHAFFSEDVPSSSARASFKENVPSSSARASFRKDVPSSSTRASFREDVPSWSARALFGEDARKGSLAYWRYDPRHSIAGLPPGRVRALTERDRVTMTNEREPKETGEGSTVQ